MSRKSTGLPFINFSLKVNDWVGEISLFEKDQEEADAAKARLNAKRKKRRERYARKKKRVNVRGHEAYVPKKKPSCLET